jgi:ribose/xylose/arabinose/galactoside ABC-type transport system permease subunit
MYINDETFRRLGTEWWIPLAVFLAVSFVLWLLLSRTVAGRHLYAMGGNEEAARLSGIRTERLKWLAYCIGSMTAAIAGILYTGAVGVANPESLGKGYELNAIAAAVVGGCGLTGGIGTVGGAMIGALFLRVVIDAVAKVVKEDPDKFEGMIVGILVVLAVAVNELRDEGWLKKRFFMGTLGLFAIVILSLAGGAVTALMSAEHALRNGAAAGAAILVLLSAKRFLESRAVR